MMERIYLGDSVYLDLERGMLRLTTDNGFGPTNEIFLEPEIYQMMHQVVQHRFAVSIDGISPMFVEQRQEKQNGETPQDDG